MIQCLVNRPPTHFLNVSMGDTHSDRWADRQIHTTVDVLEAAEHLVEEKLMVLGCEVIVGLDDLMQVGFQELKDDKDIPIGGRGWRQDNVLDLHNVWQKGGRVGFSMGIGCQRSVPVDE